jgi:hypothetical protein
VRTGTRAARLVVARTSRVISPLDAHPAPIERPRVKHPRRSSAPAPAAVAPAAPRIDWLDPRAPYLAPLLLLVLCRAFMASRIEFAGEDALITFRYAWNWVHGLGPVFNAGERVFGFTSPPWMAWIAVGLRLGVDPLAWTRVSLGLADAVTLLTAASLLERHASRASAWTFAVFFAAWPYFSGLACTGLESGAMLALVALAALLLDRRHPAAGATLGVLAVFRPEGLLAALVLALWAGWRDRIVAAGVLVVTLAVLAAYYGSPIPQSVLAKQAVYGAPGPLAAPQWWLWIVPIPVAHGGNAPTDALNLALFALVAAPAAVAGAGAVWAKRASGLAAAVAALGVVWLSLFAVGASYFFWYLAAPALAWVLLASAGLPRIARGWPLYASLALALAAHWLFEPTLYIGRANTEGLAFGTVGDYVAARARAGESLLLEPIGTIGWHCRDLRIVDEVGLVSPEATAFRRQGAGWYTKLLARRRPDWLVVRAGLLRGGSAFAGVDAPFGSLMEQGQALAPYAIVAGSDSSAGDQALMVLRRRDALR